MSGRELRCVICNEPFVRDTRGPVVTCANEECKYLNGRVTRTNAARKQQGLGRACGRCGTDLPADAKGHYCTAWCGPFQRTVVRRGRPPAGAPGEPRAPKAARQVTSSTGKPGRPATKVLGMDVSVLPEPHRSIVRLRFGNPGEIPMTIEAVAGVLGLLPQDVVSMETEALEAMGNNARGNATKRWRYS